MAGGDAGAASVLRSWKASQSASAKASAAATGMTIFFFEFGIGGPRGRTGAGGHRVKAARSPEYEAGAFGRAGEALGASWVGCPSVRENAGGAQEPAIPEPHSSA